MLFSARCSWNFLLILGLFVALVSSSERLFAGSGQAFYNPATGEVILKTANHRATAVIGLESVDSLFDTSQSPTLADLEPAQFDSRVLAYFRPTGLPAGTFSQGNILPPGLTQADLGFSSTGVVIDCTQVPVTFIPEPSTTLLTGLGFFFIPWRRRRG